MLSGSKSKDKLLVKVLYIAFEEDRYLPIFLSFNADSEEIDKTRLIRVTWWMLLDIGINHVRSTVYNIRL